MSVDDLADEIKEGGFQALEDLLERREVEQYFVDFKVTQRRDYRNERKLALFIALCPC